MRVAKDFRVVGALSLTVGPKLDLPPLTFQAPSTSSASSPNAISPIHASKEHHNSGEQGEKARRLRHGCAATASAAAVDLGHSIENDVVGVIGNRPVEAVHLESGGRPVGERARKFGRFHDVERFAVSGDKAVQQIDIEDGPRIERNASDARAKLAVPR